MAFGIYRGVGVFDRFDLLQLPAASVTPWPLTQAEVTGIDGTPLRHIIDYLTITYAISLVGLPAISIPGGLDQGWPAGRAADHCRTAAGS